MVNFLLQEFSLADHLLLQLLTMEIFYFEDLRRRSKITQKAYLAPVV
jgi:hypothetical protein